MKKALPNTKVTVKLRRSNYKEEWYLIIESYPVYKRGSTRASRVVESINRTISTPVWDKSSIARILPDGTFNYKPKRDLNGIIQCRSTIDQEACIYADNVRKLRQHEYDSAILYTDKENEIAAQNERSEQDFIKYFNSIISTRHPNSSDSIIVNWRRVGELLKMYSQGQPIPFKAISVKLLEDIKMFLLRAPMGGNKKGSISQNTASTYFSILKAGLKQAFIDEYLTVDISAKVKLSYLIESVEALQSKVNALQYKQASDSPKWMDIDELCTYLPSHPAKQTVYGWVSTKQIPVHKINKALAFLQSEIDDWLKNKSHKTQDDLMEEARRFVESKKIIR